MFQTRLTMKVMSIEAGNFYLQRKERNGDTKDPSKYGLIWSVKTAAITIILSFY